MQPRCFATYHSVRQVVFRGQVVRLEQIIVYFKVPLPLNW